MKKKICLRLSALCLLFSMPAAAQQIFVLNPCMKGTEFTLTVPFKVPDGMRVKYEWYRNGELIPDTQGEPAAGSRAIAYTIPAGDSIYGDTVAYHFMYWIDDGCDDWTSSPTYVVTLEAWVNAICRFKAGIISSPYVGCNLLAGEIEERYKFGCNLLAGEIEQPDYTCRLLAGEIISPK